MELKELLTERNISAYSLAKGTNIPYTTINDLVNGKTKIENLSLRNALLICDYLRMEPKDLASLDSIELIDFIYFRNNTLHQLKRLGAKNFLKHLIKSREIDFYYKNNGLEYALYLLALMDYLCRKNELPIYTERYNNLRKQSLENPFFVGSKLITFSSLEEAEDKLKIKIIPEFKRYNLIEGDVFNVA